jgi:DNA-binding NtrC family response regulator
VALTLPRLRDRRQDIPALVYHFLDHYGREVNRPGLGITQEALELLCAYDWPGNVRELQNAIERAVVLSQGPDLTAADFPAEIRQAGRLSADTSSLLQDIDASLTLAEALIAFKRARVLGALEMAHGNQSQAAKLLGIQPSNLSRLMHTLGLRVTTTARGQ